MNSTYYTEFIKLRSAQCDELIEINQDHITNFRRLWRVLLVGGIIIFLMGLVLLIRDTTDQMTTKDFISALAAGFGLITGSVSLYPYREITPYRKENAKLTRFKKGLEQIEKLELPEDEGQKHVAELKELLKDM
jgi:hypothetical protein